MKVLGYTDEVTTCDCCGKTNLRGSFGVETDAGEVLYYGSVCVNRVYGKKRGEALKFEARQIASVQSGTWEQAIDRLSRGAFAGMLGIKANGKYAHCNSAAEMAAVVAIKTFSGTTVRVRA